MLLLEYPKCSTCSKARKWLADHGISYDDRDIKQNNPTAEELKQWHQLSKQPLKKFFNTSGQIYRKNNLKDQLPYMTEDQMYDLLATNGMLVKRPLLILDHQVLIGLKKKNGKKHY